MNDLKLAKSRELALVLCKMFNLDPKNIIALQVNCGVNDVAKVRADMYIRTPEGKLIIEGDSVKTSQKRFVLQEEPTSNAEEIADKAALAVARATLRNG